MSGYQLLQLSLIARPVPLGIGDLGPRAPLSNFASSIAIEFGVPTKMSGGESYEMGFSQIIAVSGFTCQDRGSQSRARTPPQSFDAAICCRCGVKLHYTHWHH